VFLLHAAGVLVGRRFTTSWWLAPQLRHQLGGASAALLNVDAMVCVDGPVITAGAALAQGDLMLLLLRQRFGPALADAVGRCLLVDGRQAQAPFMAPALLSNGYAWVEQLLQYIEQALPEPPSVTELAEHFAVSPRTLSRRVREITGHSPLVLIQQVRLNRARQLIEASRLSIEAVAAQVGYQDATALRRLVQKRTGAQPSHYRRHLWAEPG
jgi:transcriptional regulator GlxA family with amidase domain